VDRTVPIPVMPTPTLPVPTVPIPAVPIPAVPIPTGPPPAGSVPTLGSPAPAMGIRGGWWTLGLLAFGLVALSWGLALLGQRLTGTPAGRTALTTAVVLFSGHGLLLLVVLRGLDFPTPRPAALVAMALGWGGLVATSLALSIETWLDAALTALAPEGFAAAWGDTVGVAVTEEAVKLLGVGAIMLLAPRRFSTVTDGLVYGALVGLGFEESENTVYAVQAAATGDRFDTVVPVVNQFLARGLVSGWGLHLLWTAVAGAGIGWLYVHRDTPWARRAVVAALAFTAAVACHALWNSSRADVGAADDVLFSLTVAVCPLVLVGCLALRGQAGSAVRRLGELNDPSVATDAEIAALRSPYRRFGARWDGYVRAGTGAAGAVRRLQRGQAELAVILCGSSGPGRGDAPMDPAGARAAIRAARQELGAKGALPTGAGVPRRGTANGWLALASAVAGPVGLQVFLVLSADVWGPPTLLTIALLLTGLGVTPLVLCQRGVRGARAAGAPADVRLGLAVLPGLAGLGLATVFAVAAVNITLS
jgi:RsiW-degrading membrane proteinase PrsW (M82 family)